MELAFYHPNSLLCKTCGWCFTIKAILLCRYERDGRVDLWVEEEFNAGSRVVVSV